MSDGYIKNIQMGSAERRAHCRLAAVCGRYEAVIFTGVGLQDVLDLEALQNDGHRGPSPKQSTAFDFLVCRFNGMPVLALDICRKPLRRTGRSYRDKDRLTQRGRLPYLRIHSKYINEEALIFSLLSWCVEQWYLLSAAAPGNAPDLFSDSCDALAWPADLFGELEYRLGRMRSWYNTQTCRVEYEIGPDNAGAYHGLATIVMDDSWGLAARCEVVSHHAAGMERDLLRVILIKHLQARFRRFELGGKCKKRKKIQRMRKKFRSRCHVEDTGLYGWGL